MTSKAISALVASDSFFLRPIFVYPSVFLLGSLFIWISPQASTLSPYLSTAFLKGLGEALTISGILGLTIELYNIRRHHRSLAAMERHLRETSTEILGTVARDASADGILSVYRTRLSEAIMTAISKDILKSELTRPFYAIRLELGREDGYVFAEQTLRYGVKNQSVKSQPHTVNFRFDKSDGGMPPFDKKINLFSYQGQFLDSEEAMEAAGILKYEDGKLISLDKQIDIPASDSTEVELRILEKRAEHDVLFWSSLIPGDRMSLTVTAKDDIDVTVESLHPDDAIPIRSSFSTTTKFRTWKWRLNGAVLPGQGVLVRWAVRPQLPA
jgi:hypothetical protein